MEPVKQLTAWQPNQVKGSVQVVGNAFIVDTSNITAPNFIVDQAGNFIITTPNITLPLNATAWTETLPA